MPAFATSDMYPLLLLQPGLITTPDLETQMQLLEGEVLLKLFIERVSDRIRK
jgi:hypothetical protein